MTLHFEQATPDDFAAIEDIYRQAFPRYVHAVGRELLSDPRGDLEAYRCAQNLWVARDVAGIAGFLMLASHADTLELEKICVLPPRQGSGVGPFLLDGLEDLARERQLLTLALHTTRKMTGLVRLYQRQGYRIIREGPPEHGLDDFTRVYMEKRLDP